MRIVKIGGGRALDLDAIVQDLTELDGPMLVVHGANSWRDDLAQQLQRPVTRVTSLSGYESVLTDDDAIDLLMLSYAGLRNKRLVERMQRAGLNAIGLTGLDGGLIRARRNPGIRTERNGRKVLLRDHSGKPVSVNTDLLQALLEQRTIPVITVPLLDETGHAVNSENDDVVALLCRELPVDEVVMLIEEAGVLRRRDDPTSLVRHISGSELREWEGEVTGRMRRKVRALGAIVDHTPRIVIGDGRIEHPIRAALAGQGTEVHA